MRFGRRGSVCVPRRGWSSSLSWFRQAWSPDRGYRVVARKDGTIDGPPRLYLGRGLHTGNLPRLARGPGRPGRLLRRPGATASDRRRNATRLAPWACRLLQRGRGRLQGKRPSSPVPEKANSSAARQDPVLSGVKGASWLPRVGTLHGGLEAGRSHLDLETEGSQPGPEAAVRAPRKEFPRHLCSSTILPQRLSAANIMVQIPGPGMPNRQEFVLNDVVDVPLKYVHEVLDGKWGQDWALGYAITVHSSQGLTVADPQKVWIIDDFLQWSNLTYLAVSRVEYMHQLERVVCPPEEGSEGHAYSQSSSSAKPSRGSWWPTSDRTRPRG